MMGVVLETYGSGNAPDNRPDLLQELKKATDSGVIIINCTQCLRGTVSASYATGMVVHVQLLAQKCCDNKNKAESGPLGDSKSFRKKEFNRQPILVIPQVLMEAGLIVGGDMTPEAALSKLSYVLAKTELDLEAKKKVWVL